jgi:hypothetical protein
MAITFGEHLAAIVTAMKVQDAITELDRYHRERDGVEGDCMGFPVLVCGDGCLFCKAITAMQVATNDVYQDAGMPAIYEIEE